LVVASEEGLSPLSEQISGYVYRSPSTQAIQDDDFENPGFLWVESGEALWNKAEGEAGKSCASCHGDAAESMKGVGARYPQYDEGLGKLISLEQRINSHRAETQGVDPWKWESEPFLAMAIYVKHQSRGMPVNVTVDGPAAPFFQKGKEFFYQSRGQLDLSCNDCHQNYGKHIRSDFLSQGQSNGFPTYRLKWQGVGSLHRRFRGCNKNIRAQPYGNGSDEYVNLELYVAWRGNGMAIETPSVRQ
jgi:sulfur-oxidizing protein SoxA